MQKGSHLHEQDLAKLVSGHFSDVLQHIQDRDIIWFVDNEAAEGAMVKAGSPQVAMCGLALVAIASPDGPDPRIIGVARYVANPDGQSCEFALTVADDLQHQGMGRRLMQLQGFFFMAVPDEQTVVRYVPRSSPR